MGVNMKVGGRISKLRAVRVKRPTNIGKVIIYHQGTKDEQWCGIWLRKSLSVWITRGPLLLQPDENFDVGLQKNSINPKQM